MPPVHGARCVSSPRRRGRRHDANAASASSRSKGKRGAKSQRNASPPPFVPGAAKRGRRLAPAYDLEGPRVRLGLAWAAATTSALAIGRLVFGFPLLCVLLSGTAAVAAVQVVDAWEPDRTGPLRIVAGVSAACVGGASMFGSKTLGAVLLLVVAASLLIGVEEASRRRPLLGSTALVLQSALPVGLAAASFELVTRYEIGAGIVLLATVLAFDLGDFLVGSGAGSLIEGPLSGALVIALVTAVAAIIRSPPFDGAVVWVFAVGAMVLCPLGQVVASWLLPDATTRAPALRRLDSMLLTAPAWAIAAGWLAASR